MAHRADGGASALKRRLETWKVSDVRSKVAQGVHQWGNGDSPIDGWLRMVAENPSDPYPLVNVYNNELERSTHL